MNLNDKQMRILLIPFVSLIILYINVQIQYSNNWLWFIMLIVYFLIFLNLMLE